MEVFILLFMFFTHDNPTKPVKQQFIAFQEKSTCEAVQKCIIKRTQKLLLENPKIKEKGKFKISKCLPSMGSYEQWDPGEKEGGSNG